MHWYNARRKGTGVCIVFDTNELLKLFAGRYLVGIVEYGDDYVGHEHFKNLIRYIISSVLPDGCETADSLFANMVASGFMCKHKSFKGEHEVRIATIGHVLNEYSELDKNLGKAGEKGRYKIDLEGLCNRYGVSWNRLVKKVIVGGEYSEEVHKQIDTLLKEKRIAVEDTKCPMRK